jgi:hypothetical protein
LAYIGRIGLTALNVNQHEDYNGSPLSEGLKQRITGMDVLALAFVFACIVGVGAGVTLIVLGAISLKKAGSLAVKLRDLQFEGAGSYFLIMLGAGLLAGSGYGLRSVSSDTDDTTVVSPATTVAPSITTSATTVQTTTSTTSAPISKLAIIRPEKKALVSRCIGVRGRAPDPPDGKQYWLVVRAMDQGTYYPNGVIATDTDGNWSQRVTLGAAPPADNGSYFQIDLVSADEASDNRFREVTNNYEKYEDTGISLPRGAEIKLRVDVRRKPNDRPPSGCK